MAAGAKIRSRRIFQIIPGTKWLEMLLPHLPDRGEHRVRYYGWYSNRARGTCRAETAEPEASRRTDRLGPADQEGLRGRSLGLSPLWRRDALPGCDRGARGHQAHPPSPGGLRAPVTRCPLRVELRPRNPVPGCPRLREERSSSRGGGLAESDQEETSRRCPAARSGKNSDNRLGIPSVGPRSAMSGPVSRDEPGTSSFAPSSFWRDQRVPTAEKAPLWPPWSRTRFPCPRAQQQTNGRP
jgi:hypothetical protein